jgi:hypothetical protein
MGKNLDPGSGINIPDPQHWKMSFFFLFLLFALPPNFVPPPHFLSEDKQQENPINEPKSTAEI